MIPLPVKSAAYAGALMRGCPLVTCEIRQAKRSDSDLLRFYEQIGARRMEQWQALRLEGDSLERLA